MTGVRRILDNAAHRGATSLQCADRDPIHRAQWWARSTQLNSSLKPLLIDMLDYIIGLGNITSGLETWRGGRVDPALVWLARHQTDTTD